MGNTELNVGAAIACFLAQEGADIGYANHKGKKPTGPGHGQQRTNSHQELRRKTQVCLSALIVALTE